MRYESEWGGTNEKWDALDPLMLDGTPEWQAEKIRIAKLRWWSEVAAKVDGFPLKPDVYHLHPIGLLSNFHTPKAVAGKTEEDDGVVRKSGPEWHSKFMYSESLSDLNEPFQGNVRRFIAALKEGGVRAVISNTYRPVQRSYIMYYAKEISKGAISPEDVPAFVPGEGELPVNIDWQHLNESGEPDIKAAVSAAKAMVVKYKLFNAVGKPRKSNHNSREAIDMSFVPGWGAGKEVVDANGVRVVISGKQGIMRVGFSYGVVHWDYYGKKPVDDDPHWSVSGG